MSAFDDLLLWVSETEGGSRPRLMGSCADVASALPDKSGRDVLDDLQALGHLHLDANRWSVVPPTLNKLAGGGGHSILVGSRPRWLQTVLQDLDGQTDAGLAQLADHLVEDLRVSQAGPDAWFLTFGPEAPVGALTRLGVRIIEDASGGLLLNLIERGYPRLERVVRPGELTDKLLDQPLQEGSLEWTRVSDDSRPGIYRYFRNNQRIIARRTERGWIEADLHWLAWRARQRRSTTVALVPRERRLYVSAWLRPPMEIERVLVLRSGLLPTAGRYDEINSHEDMWAYSNVTHGVAADVARLLNKELELK